MGTSIGLGLSSTLNKNLPWAEQPANPNSILVGDFDQEIDKAVKYPTALAIRHYILKVVT